MFIQTEAEPIKDEPIHHSRPVLGEEEIDCLAGVVRCAHLAQGPQVRAFEEEMGRFLSLAPGVATSSGTAALHLGLLALGVGPGDEVLLPSYVCTAPLLAILYTGATPVAVDVDPKTGNIDPADLKRRITRKSKAVIAVHIHGVPAPVHEILSFSLPVIEDCAQSLGAKIGAKFAGTFADLCVCSFYATKLITTGEGGMVLSSNPALIERLNDLRDYDKREDFKVRYNYKLSDLAAAMGRVQLRRLEGFLKKRDQLAAVYDKELFDLPINLPPRSEGRIYYRYVASVARTDIQALIDRMAMEGVEAARPVFRPVHMHLGLREGFEGTKECWSTHLSLPIHPGLSTDDVRKCCNVLNRVLGGLKR